MGVIVLLVSWSETSSRVIKIEIYSRNDLRLIIKKAIDISESAIYRLNNRIFSIFSNSGYGLRLGFILDPILC